MSYIPTPIDTSAVSLPPELDALGEKLAENAHDVWAAKRISQKWSYGPQRNDELKQHPCLVPYDQLPESEKDLDRSAVFETLKAILQLGYQVISPQP